MRVKIEIETHFRDSEWDLKLQKQCEKAFRKCMDSLPGRIRNSQIVWGELTDQPR
jgi:hypothetical protein